MTTTEKVGKGSPTGTAPDYAALVIAFIPGAVAVAIAWSTAYGDNVLSHSP